MHVKEATETAASPAERRWGGSRFSAVASLSAVLLLTALLPSPDAFARSQNVGGRHLRIVVAENFWGSIVKQEAGSHGTVTSIITNPNADPHSYEPTTTDARTMARANYVVLNGAGYDPTLQKLLSANPVKGRRVLNIGDFIGKRQGDNPHMWYDPSYVVRVVNKVSSDLARLDPHDAAYYKRQQNGLLHHALKGYFSEVALIARKYRGVPAGATESIFVYLASALHLKLITPPGFMKALSEGTEPTARDKAIFDDQVTHKQIKVLIFNIQNSTPDTLSLEQKAKGEGIPVVPITETLAPRTTTFQAWQVSQLKKLASALHKATRH